MDVFINDIKKMMPNQAVSNDEIEDYLGIIGGKKSRAKNIVLKNNGIQNRFYVLEKNTGKALFSNAEITAKAIRKLNIDLEAIDCLCCGTTTPDQIMPNHALMTQGELGISGLETLCTSGICLSGVNALKYAYLSIKSEEHQCAVATGSETASMLLNAKNFQEESKINALKNNPILSFEKDFLRWMLSDGAGAILLQNKPNQNRLSLKIKWIDIHSYAGEMPVCMYSGCTVNGNQTIGWRNFSQSEVMNQSLLGVQQNVKLLNENIVYYTISKPLRQTLQKYPIKPDEIDYFLPHYSSEYFRQKVYDGMKNAHFEIPFEKWFTNLTSCGNTGSASIYIILEELFHSGCLKKGNQLLCHIPESGRFSAAFMLLEVV